MDSLDVGRSGDIEAQESVIETSPLETRSVPDPVRPLLAPGPLDFVRGLGTRPTRVHTRTHTDVYTDLVTTSVYQT